MKIIRASELGIYQFCQRAYWYHLQGYEPENKAELFAGIEIHKKHGWLVMASNLINILAYGFIFLAILALIIWIFKFI